MITRRRKGEREGKTDCELGKERGAVGEKRYQDPRLICNEKVHQTRCTIGVL